MFEAEIELEKRSSFFPVLFLVCLIAAILGVAGYVVVQVRQRTPLDAQGARPIVAAAVEAAGPAAVHFRTGLLVSSVAEKPGDPHYRLLEKAGIVKLSHGRGSAVLVSLTPSGERLIGGIAGFKKWNQTDGTISYEVPLAQRQLVGIDSVTMNGVNYAVVTYTWKWLPSRLGEIFDAGNSLVKSFNTWDRQTLIDKYAVAFYSGSPRKTTVAVARGDQGWKVSAE